MMFIYDMENEIATNVAIYLRFKPYVIFVSYIVSYGKQIIIRVEYIVRVRILTFIIPINFKLNLDN